MRKIHTTLRLFFEAGLSIRAIARTLRVSPEVPAKAGMGEYLRRAQVAGLSWPLPEAMDERALEARLFPGAGVPAPARRAVPDKDAVVSVPGSSQGSGNRAQGLGYR